ncbi:ATP-dependent DNA helicase DinG [Lactovum odontotermitis]
MTRYAIVDLEATDASNSKDKVKKIIQIGIVVLENGKIADSFASNVNPHEKLSENIAKLTGLKNRELRQAPDLAEIMPQVLKILDGAIFVAHNVKFDWGLLSEHFAKLGVKLDMPRIDTVELARVFFPTFDKYGLASLSSSLQLTNAHPHAALADAEETAELLLKIQQRVLDLPIATLQEILRHADNFLYETRYLLDELIWDCQNQFDRFDVTGPIATLKKSENAHEVRLSPDFTINLKALGFKKKRKEQVLLAKIIGEDLEKPKPAFIEAQAGTGKTLAYLLPALSSGRKVVVSTPTKVLQNQIMTELAGNLHEKFAVKSVKLSSPRNYISLEKLKKQLQRTDAGKNTEIFKMKVLVWLTETNTGELSELSRNVTNQEMFDSLSHEDTLSQNSIFAAQDFWLKAQDKAAKADLIVTNHAYLIEQIKSNSPNLVNAVLIIDEAQRMFTVLENSQQQSLNTIDEILKVELSGPAGRKAQLHELLQLLDSSSIDRKRILQIAENLGLSNLSSFLSSEEKIYWSEGNQVKSSPQDFYNFQQFSVEEQAKLIFISANIAFSEKHPLLPELLGFSDYNFYKLPFKQKKNQQLLAVNDGPAVNNSTVTNYSRYIAEELTELCQLKLPIVSLFNSREMMEATAEHLAATDVSFSAQQKDQHELLKKQFDAEKFQLMLATGAFWEGVDFDKQKRIILVIARLPFATPDDILTKKFAAKFKNPFFDFNLPMAAMKLRQAIGRVNRKPSQRSVVVILDNRLSNAKYAKRLQKNLTEILPVEIVEHADILPNVREFLK